jgi:uncharacterized protein YecE (DUF72 family)
MAKLFVGTSGWVYEHWRGVFYPEGLPQSEWFGYYAKRFDTVEINYSFYRLPSRKTFETWREGAPPGFVFTVKANRYITHVKKLKDPGEAVKRFYENLYGLEDRCGAVLFQLPPRWNVNVDRLEEFLSIVPKEYRLVFEFRDESWLTEGVMDVLRRNDAALCAADSPHWPSPRQVTADFVFFRLHSGHTKEAPAYTKKELGILAAEIEGHLAENRDAFVYFNNDYGGFAIENALAIKAMIEGKGGV